MGCGNSNPTNVNDPQKKEGNHQSELNQDDQPREIKSNEDQARPQQQNNNNNNQRENNVQLKTNNDPVIQHKPEPQKNEPIQEGPSEFKYENRGWFWDIREDPFKDDKHQWQGFDEVTSIGLEKHLYDFLLGKTKNPEKLVHPDYVVDVQKCLQINLTNRAKQRPVKRGEPHQRGTRPSDLRFGSNSFAMVGKFQATQEYKYGDKDSGIGCDWLGTMFQRSMGGDWNKPKEYTMQKVLDGILREQKIWNQNLGGNKVNRDTLLESQNEGWRLMFQAANLTDEDIKMIINQEESEEADEARSKIIKFYTQETNLYTAINTASQFRDESKIQTLGPYVYLLFMSLKYEDEDSNLDKKLEKIEAVKRKELKETGYKYIEMMKLYRGLTLPEDAIQFYHKKQEDRGVFRFNGFTSTTVNKQIAIQFATQNSKEGSVPVIFEIYLRPNGFGKQFLDDKTLTAFPNEEEVLVGDQRFRVVPGEGNFQKDENGILIIQLF